MRWPVCGEVSVSLEASRARANENDDAYSRGLAGVDVSDDNDVDVGLIVLTVDRVSDGTRRSDPRCAEARWLCLPHFGGVVFLRTKLATCAGKAARKRSDMMLSSKSKRRDDGELTVKWQVIARIRYADEEGRGKAGQDVEEGSKVFMGREGGAKAGWWGRCTAKNFSATKVGQALKFWPSSEFHAAPCRPAPRSGSPSRLPTHHRTIARSRAW